MMEFQTYIELMKQLNTILLQYIDDVNDEDGIQNNFESLTKFIEENKISESKEELGVFLRLMSVFTSHHHRNPDFFNKIEKIIVFFKEKIKQFFCNEELFDMFESCKPIVVIFIENDMILINENIINLLFQRGFYYNAYFFIQIEKFLDEQRRNQLKRMLLQRDPNILENFKEKQRIGENEDYICKLIREDSIDDFILYVNRINLPLSSKIKKSIFETNGFLRLHSASLIEYSAFCGSIQIFNYLRMNNVELKPFLWNCAIYSRNYEMIHLLEELHVEPIINDKCLNCLSVALKCHHNEIAEYIQNNIITNNDNDNLLEDCLCSHNFVFFPEDYNINHFFSCCISNGYLKFVKILMKNEEIDMNGYDIFTI